MKFAYEIKRLRLFERMTIGAYAARLGIPRSTYFEWERGRMLPSFTHVNALMSIHNIPYKDRAALLEAYTSDKLGRDKRLAPLAAWEKGRRSRFRR